MEKYTQFSISAPVTIERPGKWLRHYRSRVIFPLTFHSSNCSFVSPKKKKGDKVCSCACWPWRPRRKQGSTSASLEQAWMPLEKLFSGFMNIQWHTWIVICGNIAIKDSGTIKFKHKVFKVLRSFGKQNGGPEVLPWIWEGSKRVVPAPELHQLHLLSP